MTSVSFRYLCCSTSGFSVMGISRQIRTLEILSEVAFSGSVGGLPEKSMDRNPMAMAVQVQCGKGNARRAGVNK